MSERLRDLVLWVGAVLGSLCLLWLTSVSALGLTPLVFTSGSMSPSIEAGDLSFARTIAADEVRPGDVVSVVNSNGMRITHRVVSTDPIDDGAVLTLKGDANAAPDVEAYTVSSVERVDATVPWLGHVIDAAGSPLGVFMGGLVVGGALLAGFGRGAEPPPRAGSRRRSRGRRGRAESALAVAVVGLTIVSVGQGVQPTTAAFSDAGTVNSGTVGSIAVVSPTPTCANVNGLLLLGNVARLTWTKADARLEYTWELRRTSNNALAADGTVGTGASAGSTVTLDISTGLIAINGDYDVIVRARLATTPAWVAPSTTSTPVHRTSLLVIGTSFRCGYGS